MAPYTLPQYLLDHTHILATASKFYLLTDTHQWPRLSSSFSSSPSGTALDASEVFTSPTFTLDYSSLFGGSPKESTPQEATEMFKGFIDKLTTSQHVLTGSLIEGLPLPVEGENEAEEWPTTAKVTAYVTVHLTKKGAEGGSHTSNGGIVEMEMVRVGREECARLYGERATKNKREDGSGKVGGWDGNPWRVKSFKPDVRWHAGNAAGILGVKLDEEQGDGEK
jgi:hypothetical protein